MDNNFHQNSQYQGTTYQGLPLALLFRICHIFQNHANVSNPRKDSKLALDYPTICDLNKASSFPVIPLLNKSYCLLFFVIQKILFLLPLNNE